MTDQFEIIFYAILAALACAMLYSVLGRKVGRGPEDIDLPELKPDSRTDKDRTYTLDEMQNSDNPILLGLAAIKAKDAAFNSGEFLEGAKAAYNMILDAYAEGDLDTLQTLLAPEIYESYAAAISERSSQGLTQITDLARLSRAEIVEAGIEGKSAIIVVDFIADMATALKNEAGEVVQGDLDILQHVDENWTFERNLASKDPNWLLTDVTPTEK